MRRYHLFEFNDSSWLPTLLRNYETDYLEALFRRIGIYRPVVPVLLDLLQRHDTEQLTDLCSGGGGPLPALMPELQDSKPGTRLLLTDKYPNLVAFEDIVERHGSSVQFRKEPVDVLSLPEDLGGIATIFDALHHFRPKVAKQLLAALQQEARPVAIFDVTNRSWRFVLGAVFVPLIVWILTPTMRPFRLTRLLFTYLIPILPVVIAWDGFVSHLRAHKKTEVESWLADSTDDSYQWKVQELFSGPATILTVIGEPKVVPSTAERLSESPS